MCCIKQQKEVYKMKMIAFYNNKGGVGKTSTAINIAYGELSISTANEIAKHNATKQQEIISSPIEKIKTANVRNINKDKSKAKMPKCDEPKIDSTSDEATEIYLTTDEIMFMKKNLDILGFSYLLSVSSDSDKQIIENII